MKLTALVALTVRLFSLGLLIYLIRILLGEFSAYVHFENHTISIAVAVIAIVIVFLAAFLWKFPLFIAKKLVDFGPKEDRLVEPINEQNLYNLGFVLLGTLLLYWTLSDSVYWWFYLSAQAEIAQYTQELSIQQKASLLSVAVEGIFSIALIAGAGPISRFMLWLRRAGT